MLTSPNQDFNTEGIENTEKSTEFSRTSANLCFSFFDSVLFVLRAKNPGFNQTLLILQLGGEGQQRDVARALDRFAEPALVA